jgi:site-specific recombinase XerD
MQSRDYAHRSIRSYGQECRFLFSHYPGKTPLEITQDDIARYIIHIKACYGVGRDKVRMAAQAFCFFYKHIEPNSYVKPSSLYPRKGFVLPGVLSTDEVMHLFSSGMSLKQWAMIGLFYGSGLRLNELRLLEPKDIDSKAMQLKVRAGKGRKDRFTILSKQTLEDLRAYWKEHRPKTFLFEGQQAGKPMHERSIQHAIRMAFAQAGLSKELSSHNLRHSFATHMLDSGADIHTIKELLGHSKIETTMIYLHLQQKKRQALVSPLDRLKDENGA